MAEISNELLDETCSKIDDAIDHLRRYCYDEFDKLSNHMVVECKEYEQQLQRGDRHAYQLSEDLRVLYKQLIEKVE